MGTRVGFIQHITINHYIFVPLACDPYGLMEHCQR